MDQLFLTSLIMSFIIIAFLLHRKFKGHVFSSKVYYFVWIIIAARLLFPFDISVNNPIYHFNSPINELTYMEDTIYDTTENISPNPNTSTPVMNTLESRQPNKHLVILDFLQENTFKIWLGGATICFLYHLLLYGLFSKKLKLTLLDVNVSLEEKLSKAKVAMGVNIELGIKETPLIDSPMIIGLLKPFLILPRNIDPQNIDFIFQHELIHLMRKDIAYKCTLFMATVIHWFNPLVHIMLKVAGQDLELSCDEAVVRRLSKDERILYCKTLINTISTQRIPMYTTNFSGGKKVIKKRMDTILNSVSKKSSKGLILFLALSIIITGSLIGCGTSKSPETSADVLYQYKTPYIGDNSKVGNIISNLIFPKGYNYESISLLTDSKPYGLVVYFRADEPSDFYADKLYVHSAILFSLIDNLDHIAYVDLDREGLPENTASAPKNDVSTSSLIDDLNDMIPVRLSEGDQIRDIQVVNRDNIDNITLSVLGMKTKELGSSKRKFEKLADYYDGHVIESQSTFVAGYITIKNNKLDLDEVEIIKEEDKDRIQALDLTPNSDMPNGYYIHNPISEPLSLELTDDTIYSFTDFDLVFVKEPDSNRSYRTTKKEEFIEASSYQDIPLEEQRIPYIIQVYDGKVVSITEEFVYTQ